MADKSLATAYVQVVPSARGIKGSISSLLGSEAESAGRESGESIGKQLVGTLKKVIIAAGIGKVIKDGIGMALTEAGNLQQSIGGIETLYTAANGSDKAVKSLQNYAKAAAGAGISANSYMEQATSFGAALKQSLGGDTVKAAEAANMAILSMADNSAKMGTDIGSIQMAYQGFAKQNYTMLDNLKIGYGGTKSEMERLIKDASKMKGEQKALGVTVDANSMSFANIANAISVVQKNLGIYGVAAEEASTTFTGSMGAMKAAAQNFMGQLALGADIQPALNDLLAKTQTFLTGNLFPMLKTIGQNIPKVLGFGGDMLAKILPDIAKGVAELAGQIVVGLISAIPNIINAARLIGAAVLDGMKSIDWNTIGTSILNALSSAFKSITATLSVLVPQITGFIQTYLFPAIQTAIAQLPAFLNIIGNVITPLLPQIVEGAGMLIQSLVEGIITLMPTIVIVAIQLGQAFIQALTQVDWASVGSQIMQQINTAFNGNTGAMVATFAGLAVAIGSKLSGGLLPCITTIGSALGKLTSGIGTVASGVLSKLGGASAAAAAPVQAAGSSIGVLSQNALGLVAAGAGILLASSGIALLAKSAIDLAGAGPGAALAMAGLTAAVAGMAVGAAALAPALTAGAAGLVAFGAGITLIGGGIFLATSGVTLLAAQLPNIASNGGMAAAALTKIGAAMVKTSAGSAVLAAGFTAMLVPVAGAAVTIGGTDLALAGLTVTISTAAAGAGLLGAAMKMVASSVTTISSSASEAGRSMQMMVTSVGVVNTAVDGLKTKLTQIGEAIGSAFTQSAPTVAAGAKMLSDTAIAAAVASIADGGLRINTTWSNDLMQMNITGRTSLAEMQSDVKIAMATLLTIYASTNLNGAWSANLGKLTATTRSIMSQVETTIKGSLNSIEQQFANTRLEFSRNIKLPHFSMSGSFDPQSGSTPHVSVDWYRKAYDNAYILNGATIFGAMNGNLLGGGEGRGSEIVIGTERLAEVIREAVGGTGGFNQQVVINSPKELSPSEVARQTRNATRDMVLALRGV